MADLEKGHSIQTKGFKRVVVEQKLGEGGQGAVYQVNYDGKPKALKWYTGKLFSNPLKFYENLENNIKKGKPANAFLWPEDITERSSKMWCTVCWKCDTLWKWPGLEAGNCYDINSKLL